MNCAMSESAFSVSSASKIGGAGGSSIQYRVGGNGYNPRRCFAVKADGGFMVQYDATLDFSFALVIGLLL